MPYKTCEDCWYCKEVLNDIVLSERVRTCTVRSLATGVNSYDKACDEFVSNSDGLKRFMETYKAAQKSNTTK